MLRISCLLFLSLTLFAQDAVNPCAVDQLDFDCSGGHAAEAEIVSIKLNNKRREDRNVATDEPLEISARLKYTRRAKGVLTTTFTEDCPDRVENKRIKPEVLVTWTAVLTGSGSGVQNFSGSGLAFSLNAPPIAEFASLVITFSLAPGPAGCVTVDPGSSRTFNLTVSDGPYLTGITALDVAGYHKRLTPVASGTYLIKNSGETLDLTANTAGVGPDFDPNTISWSSVPADAGSFIDGANTGETVRWRQNNTYVSAAHNELVITATIPGGTPTKYFLTVLAVEGAEMSLETSASDTAPNTLTPATGLDHSALSALVARLNTLSHTTRQHTAGSSDSAILAAATVPTALTAYQLLVTGAQGSSGVSTEITAGNIPGSYWATLERNWEGSDVLLSARKVTVGGAAAVLSGVIKDSGGSSGPVTRISGSTLALELFLNPGQSVPAGKAVIWTMTGTGGAPIAAVPTGADSLTADVSTVGLDVGTYTVTTELDGTPIDSFEIALEGIDLAVNTDNHPQTAGLPIASTSADITPTDNDLEASRGGYLWVNDDNDHAAQGNKIDLEDSAVYSDDDLEPLAYQLPTGGIPAGYELSISYTFPGDDVFKLWGGNKENEVDDGTHDEISDFDPDSDGYLWVEGLKPGTGTITFKLLDSGGTEVSSDTVKLTVFGVGSIDWAGNGTTTVDPTPGVAPTGQTRTGSRIFPDKRTPTDTATRDQPKLTAAVTPAIPAGSGWEVPLVVRIFDVDHYSKGLVSGKAFDQGASSIDPEGGNDGREPNDNRTGWDFYGTNGDFGEDNDDYAFGMTFVSGDNVTFNDSTDTRLYWAHRVGGDGTADTILHIPEHTPCNNWRAAAALAGFGQWHADRPIRIDNAGNDGTTLEYISNDALTLGGGTNATAARSTDTLTVWRKVYMEQDIMGPVDVYHPTDDSSAYPSIYVGNVTSGAGGGTLYTDIAQNYVNRFEGGIAKCLDGANNVLATIKIDANSNTGGNLKLDLHYNSPAGTTKVVIADDDVTSMDVDVVTGEPINVVVHSIPAAPNYARFHHKDLFQAACIEIDMNVLNAHDTPNAPFYTMLPNTSAIMANQKGVVSQPDFWVVTHLVAYEFTIQKSGDPDGVTGTSIVKGITEMFWNPSGAPPANSSGGFFTFQEGIWDATNYGFPLAGQKVINYPKMHVQTALHECGHAMGGNHNDGGLMSEGDTTLINTDNFNGLTLRRFMLLRDEGP